MKDERKMIVQRRAKGKMKKGRGKFEEKKKYIKENRFTRDRTRIGRRKDETGTRAEMRREPE